MLWRRTIHFLYLFAAGDVDDVDLFVFFVVAVLQLTSDATSCTFL